MNAGPVDGRDAECPNDAAHGPPRERRALGAREEVEEGRDAVGRQEHFNPPRFRRDPELRGRAGMGRPLEGRIEDDVDVGQDAFQRYFRTRWRRYSVVSTVTPLSSCRRRRSSGVGSGPSLDVACETRSRYSSTIRDTEVPCLAA